MNIYEARKIIKAHNPGGSFDPLALLMGNESPEQAAFTEACFIENQIMTALENGVKTCTTDSQVLKLIKKLGFRVVKDTSGDCNVFSIWLDEDIRIYKYRPKCYKLQKWQHVNVTYSGIPTFFATDSYF